MALQIEKLTVPLETTADGTVKVRGTRIPLDTIVIAFQLGSTPQDIARQYSPLNLADIYAVLAYYLQHKDDVDQYLREREAEAERVRAEIEARWPREGVRERLMARRKDRATSSDAPTSG